MSDNHIKREDLIKAMQKEPIYKFVKGVGVSEVTQEALTKEAEREEVKTFEAWLVYILQKQSNIDVECLLSAQKTYGNSWMKRGGVGAFMMLARKWDRIENVVKGAFGPRKWDIFLAADRDLEDAKYRGGVLDDIADLRRYLHLVEAYVMYSNKDAIDPDWHPK